MQCNDRNKQTNKRRTCISKNCKKNNKKKRKKGKEKVEFEDRWKFLTTSLIADSTNTYSDPDPGHARPEKLYIITEPSDQ